MDLHPTVREFFDFDSRHAQPVEDFRLAPLVADVEHDACKPTNQQGAGPVDFHAEVISSWGLQAEPKPLKPGAWAW